MTHDKPKFKKGDAVVYHEGNCKGNIKELIENNPALFNAVANANV